MSPRGAEVESPREDAALPTPPSRRTTAFTLAGLLLLGALVAERSRRATLPEIAWPDECIYLVGARNLVERGTLDTNFYLTHSLLVRGHPHRDVHMPGYVLALAPFVRLLGPGLAAGAALNVALFLASIVLVFFLARGLLRDHSQATAAAALFAVLPPFPGYLFVVYPDIVVSFVLLAGLVWLVNGGGRAHAAVAGLLYGLSAVFRETLLLTLPLYLVRIPRRDLLRAFLPAALATLLLVVAPLARNRAVHPNALYPSVLEEALRTESPVATLAGSLWTNARENLRLAGESDPWRNPEDAALLFLALLALGAALSLPLLPRPARRAGLAAFGSMALLSAAVLVLYVVRARGGVWGGVRAYMPWAPLLLVLATPLLPRPRRRWASALLVAAAATTFLALYQRQIRFFNRYKSSDLEDQDRNARYIARYIDRYAPRRIVSRSFLYGLTHYPVEVVWSLPRDYWELLALEKAIGYDFLVIHERSPIRLFLIDNPRYVRINKDDRGAEFLIWRRLY